MTGFAAHMLDAVRDFLVSAVHHRALHRIAEVAAGALGHVAAVRVGVAAFGALEAFFGRFEVTFETAFVATVDWRVRAEIADADGVGVVPHRFERLRIGLQARGIRSS